MSAAAAGVTESLFGRYFPYLMKKLSFRQTIAQVTLLLKETLPWGSYRADGRLVEVNARLRVYLTVGCPGVGATLWL